MNSRCKVLCVLAVMTLAAFPASGDEIKGVILRLDPDKGLVVVDDDASCFAYQLTLQPGQTVRQFKKGQKVSIDPGSKTLASGTVRTGIRSADPLDERNVKIVSVDETRGVVKAEFETSRETTTFTYDPDALKKKALRVGQTMAVGSMATAARGKCHCGQKNDGTCWCVKSIIYCCGVKIPNCRCEERDDKDILPPW